MNEDIQKISENKVILTGYVTGNTKKTSLPYCDAVTNIKVAVTNIWKNKAGKPVKIVDVHRVVFYNRLATEAFESLCGKENVQIRIIGFLSRINKRHDYYVTVEDSIPSGMSGMTERREILKRGPDRYVTVVVAKEMNIICSNQDIQVNQQDHDGYIT
jgi:hypothetical protein